MNAVDYAKEAFAPKSVSAVHYPGDFGGDAAAGAKYAAEKLGLTFKDVPTASGQDKQAAAIAAIVADKPDLVILTTGPTDAAVIVGGAASQGYKGHFIGTAPTWNPALLKSAAAPAIKALYLTSAPWLPFGADTPGHKALREAVGTPSALNDGYTYGWVWSYPLKAGLEKAVANGDLTHKGLLTAIKSLTSVDFEGMLPSTAGNYAGGPAERAQGDRDPQAGRDGAHRCVVGQGPLHRSDRGRLHPLQGVLPLKRDYSARHPARPPAMVRRGRGNTPPPGRSSW